MPLSFTSKIAFVAIVRVTGLFIDNAEELNILETTVVDSNALNFSSGAANFSQNVNDRTYQCHPLTAINTPCFATIPSVIP